MGVLLFALLGFFNIEILFVKNGFFSIVSACESIILISLFISSFKAFSVEFSESAFSKPFCIFLNP